MAKPKLTTPDKQMLALIEILKDRGDIRFRQEFCDAIDIPKQNIRNIKNGIQHFTAVQIMRACKEYNVNANWIMGLSDQVFVSQAKTRFIGKPGAALNLVQSNKSLHALIVSASIFAAVT